MSQITRRKFVRDGAVATLGVGWTTGLFACSPSDSALEVLNRKLRGTLLLPRDPRYNAAATTANGRYHAIRPLAVAQCKDESDVVTCVNWCTEFGVQPVARGGGHSYAGFSATTGLMVDIRRLNAVAIDAENGTAVTGGAALNRHMCDKSVHGPFILPVGTCLDVGLGGLVLGGGIGYNTHWAGLTSDHLKASRIVTANGELLDLNASTNEDLCWACRGGAGGSFGINTSFTFELVKVPVENVAYYRFEWRGADAAAAVLAAFDQLLPKAPAAFNAVAMAQAGEIGKGGPREAIDVMSRGHYLGPVDDLRDLVAPLLAAAKPTKQTVEEVPFWDMQKAWTSEETESHSFGDISRYAAEPLPEKATNALIELLAECPSRSEKANGSIWSLGWVGGEVVDRFGPAETAYVHRNMSTLWRPTIVWPNDAPKSVGDELQEWVDEMIAVIAPFTPDNSYQNFPNRSLVNWQEASYGENLGRLIKVKRQYDKGNVFRNPQSIPVG